MTEPRPAAALSGRLRGAALLRGARGAPRLDAAAAATVGLSRFAAAHPEILEIEVDPRLVLSQGAVAFDARGRTREEERP